MTPFTVSLKPCKPITQTERPVQTKCMKSECMMVNAFSCFLTIRWMLFEFRHICFQLNNKGGFRSFLTKLKKLHPLRNTHNMCYQCPFLISISFMQCVFFSIARLVLKCYANNSGEGFPWANKLSFIEHSALISDENESLRH